MKKQELKILEELFSKYCIQKIDSKELTTKEIMQFAFVLNNIREKLKIYE